MNRIVLFSWIGMMAVMSITAVGQDAVQKELDRAKAAYQTEKEAYRISVLKEYDKKQDLARKAGDKKLIDQLKSERDAIEYWGAIPIDVTPAAQIRRAKARTRVEEEFKKAIKARLRAKDDAAAAVLEKELLALRGDDWPHLALESAKFVGDAIQIGGVEGVYGISTKEEFSGPVEINAVARTDENNIRLYAARGSAVILNWEGNRNQLRVTRPDGGDKVESGSIAAARFEPLKKDVWYKLRWRITDEGMQVFVNDKLIFSETKKYDLTSRSRISINATDSIVEVRDLHVIPLTNVKQ